MLKQENMRLLDELNKKDFYREYDMMGKEVGFSMELFLIDLQEQGLIKQNSILREKIVQYETKT